MEHTYKKTDTKFQAGKYIIGDLCYLIEDKEWGR
jgi:hypothetical protein